MPMYLGIDLIERFCLYSDQNQIFECKIKMKHGNVNNNGFHVDINKYPINNIIFETRCIYVLRIRIFNNVKNKHKCKLIQA